ncbi:12014_t:CDS:2 [Entrophospora sp. SA101]|nr:12014_t:CDS:2 [Entrophospora sp. SA101]CAJ0827640.1 14040_t:CDS:2 [Entrophospora sp. SA101]
METLEATDYSFLTYDPNNTTTKETSTLVPSPSAPRKVFKPTKKSDKKINPTNQKIILNKSSDVSSSDDQNDEEPLAALMDENINPNYYVRGGNNNHFNNFNPPSRSESPNQFRPLSHFPHGHLSAREQELIARETGSTLINLPEKPRSPQTGLIGAIAAREVHRKSLGPGVFARQAEAERERDWEHRLMEQRQQLLIAEREHSLHNRPAASEATSSHQKKSTK